MTGWKCFGLPALVAALLISACTSESRASVTAPTGGQEPGVKKRITAATNGSLIRAIRVFTAAGDDPPGSPEFEVLVNAGLTIRGHGQPLEPQLAEAVPSLENGLWKVFPDGRMETTWKIRPDARWHDGTPFSAEDVVFTGRILQDDDLDFLRDARFASIDAIEASDPRTVTVKWKRPSIEADQLFAAYLDLGVLPLPRHILEEPYLANKTTFAEVPFWTSQFVGTGPYRIQDWVPGSHAVLTANDTYVLGRPKIDEIEVKFIPSSPTLVVNILAGAVELTLGRGISMEQASELRTQWRDGTVQTTPTTPNNITPQHLNPNPAVIGHVPFRRALYHAIDRAEMAPGLTAGLGVVAHSGLPIDHPAYRQADDAVVKYDYDPARAVRLIEGLGYTRGADAMFHDAAGQRLSVEIRSTEKDINVRTVLAVADQWRRAGVATEPVVIPAARATDRAYRATFPGFQSGGNFGNFRNLKDIRRAELPTPENGYRGRNGGGYVNAELEGLIDRFYVTVPMQERVDVLRSIFRHLTDQVVVMNLYHDVDATMVSNRLSNVVADYAGNIHEWDVK